MDCSEFFNLPAGSIVYDLIAVINHHGHTEGGHYTAFANMSTSPENDAIFDWKCFNDSSVYRISQENVEVNPNAYILFYQLRNTQLLLYDCL